MPEADGTTPLMRAVHGQMPEIAQLLIDASADVTKANYYGVTALYIAARAGDPVATQLLLAAGADANAALPAGERSEEHTSELQALMRTSYAVFCLKKKII